LQLDSYLNPTVLHSYEMSRMKKESCIVFALCVCSTLIHLAQAQLYVAEGYFVVEDETVQKYVRDIPGSASPATKRAQAITELNKDIVYILTEVNTLLGSLAMYGVNVEVRIKKLDILSSNIIPSSALLPGTENVAPSENAMATFENWLVAQNSYNTIQYDFAYFWTGYDLRGDTDEEGRTHTGTICNSPYAVSMSEFDRTYITALVTAQQISQILGSQHAGVYSSGENRWLFSSAVAADIKTKLTTLSPNCLLTTSATSTKPFVEVYEYDGHILNPDITCQRRLNYSSSYMCTGWHLYNDLATGGDRVCSTIYCNEKDTTYCSKVITPEGMICESGKRCRHGSCVVDIHTPTNIDPSCVFGDQSKISIGNFTGTCHEYIRMFSARVCYDSFIDQVCCMSCKGHHTGRTGCEYGDRNDNCHAYSSSICSDAHNQYACCDYCSVVIGKRTVEKPETFHLGQGLRVANLSREEPTEEITKK
ncbi:A disintegrin and metalloproteinase with thrombospondin motifs 9, partial [Biomphalaria pfeifferi]